jgi:hypothetical protein
MTPVPLRKIIGTMRKTLMVTIAVASLSLFGVQGVAYAGTAATTRPAITASDPWGNNYPQLCQGKNFSTSDFWSDTNYYFQGAETGSGHRYLSWYVERYYWFNNQWVTGSFEQVC